MLILNKVHKIVIGIMVCMTITNITAQESGINFEVNLGTTPTSPLKLFHNSLKDQVDFENFKTTDNFYYNYGFSVGFSVENIKSSFFYANRVSGAKSSVADYSGHFRLTNELKGSTIGYRYYLNLVSNEKSHLYAQFKGLVTFSSFNITSDLTTSGTNQFDSLDFKSIDYGLGGGLLYEYPLGFLVLRAYIDLDLYYGGRIKLKEDNPDGGYLLNENGDKLTTGWSGLTVGMGFTIPM
ncbi:hypothetical protein [Maribacter sp.]|nr:hypothetical protein [Maribacter sp.]HDZ06141.1 hypothetical protein [Maribacter sp.]